MASELTAVGCHVFAAGFMGGVQKVMPVKMNIERHGFGLATAEKAWGIPVHNSHPSEWPRVAADALFANPRCTGFSCVTAGYSEDAHGPYAKQCQDIHDTMEYALGHYPIIIWESVQQAYTVGKPLVDMLAERCVAAGYRVAHLFVNAMTFGNAQNRKRYFFVAYPKDKQFNVSLPKIASHPIAVYDAIWDLRHRDVNELNLHATADYTEDSHLKLTADEKAMVPILYTGADLNGSAPFLFHQMPIKLQNQWKMRASDMPYSMHSISRMAWMCASPTLKNSSGRLIHPWLHRPLTVLELSTIMGWDRIPVGRDPIGQIAKGVVPAVGEWLAQQCVSCLNDTWGGEEWDTAYDHRTASFIGKDTKGQDVKEIDVTDYRGWSFSLERFPEECRQQMHKANVCSATGKLIKPWKDVERVA